MSKTRFLACKNSQELPTPTLPKLYRQNTVWSAQKQTASLRKGPYTGILRKQIGNYSGLRPKVKHLEPWTEGSFLEGP